MMSMNRRRAPRAVRSLTRAQTLYLAGGTVGSLLWVAYWVKYFAGHCQLGTSLACVEPNVLWTVYYNLVTVLIEVLGVPALVFAAWFAVKASQRDRDSR
jgi:membrane protease YdiL (CAAX protease family)